MQSVLVSHAYFHQLTHIFKSTVTFEQRQEAAEYEFKQFNGFWSAEDYYGFVNIFKYEKEKIVLDKYSIFEAGRSRFIYNWLQYYSMEELTREFSKSGFSIMETYADTTGAAYSEGSSEIAVVAKKID